MQISGIPDNSLFNNYIAPLAEDQVAAPALGTSHETGKQHELFKAVMQLQIHFLIMNAWDSFADSQKDLAEKKEHDAAVHDYRYSEDEARRQEGQKRLVESHYTHSETHLYHTQQANTLLHLLSPV